MGTDETEPRGLAALRHLLVDDEGGSAAVEFIVLIPVYLLMMCALFSVSQLMLARQSVVAAARFQAWTEGSGGAPSNAAVKDAFFGALPGTWSAAPAKPNVTVGLSISDALATKVLENQVVDPGVPQVAPLRQVDILGRFTYNGLAPIIGVRRAFNIATHSVVVLTNDHERPLFRDRQTHEHTMLSSAFGRASTPFDPIGKTNVNQAFTSPIVNPTFTRDPGNDDPGIWHRDARINGTDRTEHGFYAPGGTRRP